MASKATVAPGAYPPPDPDPPHPTMYAMTSLPLRGLNLILLIIAILLCLEGMELGFLAFIILAIALEVIDLLFGIKELRRLWRGVEHCIGVWRAGHEASISQSPPPPRL